jgi:hypothetical protein
MVRSFPLGMLGRGRIKTRGKKATDQVIITSDFGEFE